MFPKDSGGTDMNTVPDEWGPRECSDRKMAQTSKGDTHHTADHIPQRASMASSHATMSNLSSALFRKSAVNDGIAALLKLKEPHDQSAFLANMISESACPDDNVPPAKKTKQEEASALASENSLCAAIATKLGCKDAGASAVPRTHKRALTLALTARSHWHSHCNPNHPLSSEFTEAGATFTVAPRKITRADTTDTGFASTFVPDLGVSSSIAGGIHLVFNAEVFSGTSLKACLDSNVAKLIVNTTEVFVGIRA